MKKNAVTTEKTTTDYYRRKVNIREALGIKKGLPVSFSLSENMLVCRIDPAEILNIENDEEFLDHNVNGEVYDIWSSKERN